MRRKILTVVLAGLVIIVAVPLGAAFTFDRAPLVLPDAALLEAAGRPAGALLTPWPEAGSLLIIGGLLLGLASIVRRG